MLRSLWLQGFGFGWILRLAGLLGGFFDECGGLSWGCSEGRVGGGGDLQWLLRILRNFVRGVG